MQVKKTKKMAMTSVLRRANFKLQRFMTEKPQNRILPCFGIFGGEQSQEVGQPKVSAWLDGWRSTLMRGDNYARMGFF
jgi:hypothetical protein